MATNPYASIALKENPYAKIAIQDDQPPSDTTTPKGPGLISQGLSALGDFGTGMLKGAASTIRGIGNLEAKIPGVKSLMPADVQDYLGSEGEAMNAPTNTAQSLGRGVEQAGEFLLPGGAEKKAISLAPRILRPVAEMAVPAISAGLVNKAQGGDFSTGAAGGAVGAGIGKVFEKAAPSLAETALRVTKPMRAHGREIGRAALDYTRGIRPETIGRTANEAIGDLESAAMTKIHPSQTMNLAPVRSEARQAMVEGPEAENIPSVINAGRGLEDLLHTRYATGAAIPEDVTAKDALNLRRGVGRYLPEGTWNPETSNRMAPLRNRIYGKFNEEIGKSFPSIREADRPISSLIPVSRQAESIGRGAPVGQRILGRFGAHTGALTLGGLGAAGGYREGGVPGAIAGGLTGVVAPELIASPEGQMALARTLYKSGTLRPVVGSALQLDRERNNK